MSEPLLTPIDADQDFRGWVELQDAFCHAMISNDVSRIGGCIVDDWVLVTPEVGIVTRDRLFGVIATGVLSHETMTKAIVRVRTYGDTVVVTSRERNTGTFRGAPISADEWVTDVFVKVNGRWLCTLTHLTPAAGEPRGAEA
jgi:ketosteroid isomerase-like protein